MNYLQKLPDNTPENESRLPKSLENTTLLQRYVFYEKTVVAERKQLLRGVSRKQLILNCKNVKTDNLQLENP